MLRRLLSRYDLALHEKPLLVKSLTSCGICGAGDIFSQVAIERTENIQVRRIFNFSLLGGLLVGPTLHFWYGFLARNFPGQIATQTLKRTFADQFIFAPVFLGVFISSLSILQGESMRNNLENRWTTTVIANWGLWIPAQAINFRFIPVMYQVLVSNITALSWNTYLSWSAHITKPEMRQEVLVDEAMKPV